MADTALDVIKDAMRDLGILGKAQDIDDDDAARGLQRLNDMLDFWSLKPYALYSWTDVTHTLHLQSIAEPVWNVDTKELDSMVEIFQAR